ncbi:uncharacterized protein PGTG_12640 [Puccinia graminis f. sp. tritici CRL 75-36-700-3]|uniref:Pterin-binding domain-containing protein n=1 Tax=Puccinia graminis f. sp. tritici (strain CRL 75-36-700-3 / race SCCL) TaxID=418459 RepID=E3KRH4_PUCGT|nr:uncharacterized protein PGTG_12640 [Puccinia graminis f. sp. tritici CRL 75-36-700-3]EFP86899.2 hypothetical protein PGTG_12640 [Puccinia graminis f. sp. tritici CRL 75-36-700-3]
MDSPSPRLKWLKPRWIIHPGLGRIATKKYSSGKHSNGSKISSNALQSLSHHDPSTRVFDSSFDNLTIPHIGIIERQFVLDPLIESVDPSREFVATQTIHPETGTPIEALVADLKQKTSSSAETTGRGSVRKTHLIRGPGCQTLDLISRTHLMSIVNCTPDSFLDGGASLAVEDAVRNSLDGRDGDRTDRTRDQAATIAGATIVNDVSGGEADEAMLATVARFDVPYMLMRMRGKPRTMTQLTSYQDRDVVAGVRRELAAKVSNAGSWNLIIDPGFGFDKDLAGNYQDCLRGFPILVGLSRKQFLAKLLTLPPPGTTTTTTPPPPLLRPDQQLIPAIVASTIAICNGAHLTRAHDTKIIKKVINIVGGIRAFNSF